MAEKGKVTLIADERVAVIELDRQVFEIGEEFTVSVASAKEIVAHKLAHYKTADSTPSPVSE